MEPVFGRTEIFFFSFMRFMGILTISSRIHSLIEYAKFVWTTFSENLRHLLAFLCAWQRPFTMDEIRRDPTHLRNWIFAALKTFEQKIGLVTFFCYYGKVWYTIASIKIQIVYWIFIYLTDHLQLTFVSKCKWNICTIRIFLTKLWLLKLLETWLLVTTWNWINIRLSGKIVLLTYIIVKGIKFFLYLAQIFFSDDLASFLFFYQKSFFGSSWFEIFLRQRLISNMGLWENKRLN